MLKNVNDYKSMDDSLMRLVYKNRFWLLEWIFDYRYITYNSLSKKFNYIQSIYGSLKEICVFGWYVDFAYGLPPETWLKATLNHFYINETISKELKFISIKKK